MFARIYASFFCAMFTLSLLAVATPWAVTPTVTVTLTAPAPTATTISQCNTGDIQCCDQVLESDSDGASILLSLLGIALEGVTGLIGFNCSPLTVVGVGSGESCSASPVCCENNSVVRALSVFHQFAGLISGLYRVASSTSAASPSLFERYTLVSRRRNWLALLSASSSVLVVECVHDADNYPSLIPSLYYNPENLHTYA
ncbi:hypothetical protein NM688_g6019 [Phlebia brevispora]|uniref:Uncharacterized protein n=1 Tax=Phlebia brevispora TaxID=194682 RepID=A0ACC1SL89_9APHY|nr:hypothetical protein NM688_g6019 [Phlebia brevispora]